MVLLWGTVLFIIKPHSSTERKSCTTYTGGASRSTSTLSRRGSSRARRARRLQSSGLPAPLLRKVRGAARVRGCGPWREQLRPSMCEAAA